MDNQSDVGSSGEHTTVTGPANQNPIDPGWKITNPQTRAGVFLRNQNWNRRHNRGENVESFKCW